MRVAFICTSLLITGAQRLPHARHLSVVLEAHLLRPSPHFVTGLLVGLFFFAIYLYESLYILDTNRLTDIGLADVFSISRWPFLFVFGFFYPLSHPTCLLLESDPENHPRLMSGSCPLCFQHFCSSCSPRGRWVIR